MEMPINESINQIIDSLMGEKANLLNHSDRVALTNALNTMQKYQKIEQIFCRYDNGELTHNMFGLLVGKVIEGEEPNNSADVSEKGKANY